LKAEAARAGVTLEAWCIQKLGETGWGEGIVQALVEVQSGEAEGNEQSGGRPALDGGATKEAGAGAEAGTAQRQGTRSGNEPLHIGSLELVDPAGSRCAECRCSFGVHLKTCSRFDFCPHCGSQHTSSDGSVHNYSVCARKLEKGVRGEPVPGAEGKTAGLDEAETETVEMCSYQERDLETGRWACCGLPAHPLKPRAHGGWFDGGSLYE
jgi:hypothetical protein